MGTEKTDTKELRELVGWSQARLAEHFGIPVRTVEGWDAKKTLPIWIKDLMMEHFVVKGWIKK